jgi:hypothetical protein
MPNFQKIVTFHNYRFSTTVFHTPLKNPPRPMENSVDNVENLVKSSFFEASFSFAYGKLFKKACQELFENKSFSAFCTRVEVRSKQSLRFPRLLATKEKTFLKKPKRGCIFLRL